PDWSGPYTRTQVWHEPFVIMSFIAGCTSRVRLGTSVLVLPLRQTALTAKQSAEVDVLSGGRFFLGIGVGWNEVEFEAMNQEFHTRGARTEEQIALMQALWTGDSVTFDGRWHHLDAVGINPLPVQRPIPIWMGGGGTTRVQQRIARLADGWFPEVRTAAEFAPVYEGFKAMVAAAGRKLGDVAICARTRLTLDSPEDAIKEIDEWGALGASHVQLSTNRSGMTSLEQHIEAYRRFRVALG
ncbi:MAG: LLM class F420-dependent oxidoreductase, partial [Chloroflexota bacterium]